MAARPKAVRDKIRSAPTLNVELLERTFAALAPRGEELVARFYDELFLRHPGVIPMFANTTPAEQQKKLLAALALVVNNLRKPEVLGKALRELGARHQGYGAEPAHYGAVAETLLDVMRDMAGPLWTKPVHKAWSDALSTVANMMLSAYGKSEGKTMAKNNSNATAEVVELRKMRAAVENSMTAIMMVDRNLTVTYANKATIDLLSKHQATLRSIYPGFDASKIVGQCIDQFHANPAHQRKLLGDANNLPYKTDIKVGPLTMNLNVNAMRDAAGNYIGNNLEWADVTEARKSELAVARLQSAVNGAQANLMMCDENLNITYVNPAVIEMMVKRENELRKNFPGFEARNLVGKNIDMFHKNPAHQRALLKDKSRLPAKAEIKVAGLEFEVNATFVADAKGNYMGNMVEWKDITEQKDAQRQIEKLITAAIAGDLAERIDDSNYEGFMKNLAAGINDLMNTVVQPIDESTRVVQALAKGKLTDRMTGEYQGQFATMRDAINSSMANLLDMVSKIRESTGQIDSGATEIAQGNADLSQRTEEQASSLEETASSMEQMTSTVKQNADNARQANQLAADARKHAEQGGQVVGNAITAMGGINQSSKKIADIIGVIDEIAFQTNLLALNAAVEAARAGEQGRGFAVVATEVRNLAQRSAAAAKEIKTLIKDSVERVEEGSKLVNESGKTLTEIVSAVKKVSDIIAEIAAASQEQSSGIEQVNKAIMQMDEVTQQNAALVEEAAAASEAMSEQAKGLTELMEFFDVGHETAKAAPTARASMRPAPAAHAAPAARRGSAPPARARAPVPKAPAAGRAAPRSAGAAQADGDWEEF